MIGSAIRNPGSFAMAEIPFPLEGRRVWVAGHRGLVGSAVALRLARAGATVLGVPRADLDLRRAADVEGWLDANRPDAIVLAAGTVGGILANDGRPAEFLYDTCQATPSVTRRRPTSGAAGAPTSRSERPPKAGGVSS